MDGYSFKWRGWGAGGLLIVWNSDLFESVTSDGVYFIDSETKREIRWESRWITCIYGPSINLGKLDFWTELNDIGNLIDEPCCIGGDFNEILYPSDRKGMARSSCHH